MTLKDLKARIIPGAKLVLVHCLMGPCRKERTVAEVNTVDFMMTGDGIREGRVSHCRWPKASQLEETAKGFRVWEDDYRGGREIGVEYEWA